MSPFVAHVPLTRVLLFTSAYFALSRAGLAFVDPGPAIAVLWPASGLSLAVLTLSRRGHWPALLAGLFLANLAAQFMVRSSVPVSLALAGVNMIEPMIAATVLRRASGVALRRHLPSLLSPRGVLALGVSALTSAAFCGALGATVVAVAFGAPWLTAALTWAAADGLGMLLVAPVLLVAMLRPPAIRPDLRVLAKLLASGLVAWIVFWSPFAAIAGWTSYVYLTAPLIVLMAVRGRPLAAITSVLVVAVIGSSATIAGRGPFARSDLTPLEQIVSLQIFLGLAALGTLLLSGVIAARRAFANDASASSERFRSVLRAATEFAVIATDRDGVITVFNEGAERLLGYSADELVGRATPGVFHDDDEIAARAAELGLEPGFEVFVEQARRGRPETRDWTYVRADGARLTVSLTVTCMLDGAGRLSGFIGMAHDITARRAAEAALASSEERHRLLVANLPDTIVALYDRDLRCVMVDGPKFSAQGLRREDFVGRLLRESLPPDRVAALEPLYRQALHGVRGHVEFVSPTNGRVFDLDVFPYLDGTAEPRGVYVVTRDVTERRAQEVAVRRAEADLRTIFVSAPIGQAVLDGESRVLTLNPALTEILGYASDQITGVSFAEFADPDDAGRLDTLLGELRSGVSDGIELELRVVHGSGTLRVVMAHATRLSSRGEDEERILIQILDVTERKRFEERLRHMADHDALTGLANRRRLEQELARHVEHVARYGAEGAVLVFDIDHFKQVNDTLGHRAGDELIISVARLVRQRLRASDTVARLGGDEFAVLLPRADRGDAATVAEDLVAVVRSEATQLGGQRRPITISLGVTMIEPCDGLTGEAILNDADLAMYDAKDRGRDGYAFFATENHTEASTKSG